MRVLECTHGVRYTHSEGEGSKGNQCNCKHGSGREGGEAFRNRGLTFQQPCQQGRAENHSLGLPLSISGPYTHTSLHQHINVASKWPRPHELPPFLLFLAFFCFYQQRQKRLSRGRATCSSGTRTDAWEPRQAPSCLWSQCIQLVSHTCINSDQFTTLRNGATWLRSRGGSEREGHGGRQGLGRAGRMRGKQRRVHAPPLWDCRLN